MSRTRRAVDKGRINNFESICRTLGIDDEGNVYGSFGDGQIFKYDPRTDCDNANFAVRVPIRPKGISFGRDYWKSETAWRTVVWDERRVASTAWTERDNSVLLRPQGRRGWRNPRTGAAVHPGIREGAQHPYATLSLTLGHDRKLYYGAPAANSTMAAAKPRSRSPDHLRSRERAKSRTSAKCCSRTAAAFSAPTPPIPAPMEPSTWWAPSKSAAKPGVKPEAGGKIGDEYYRLALLMYHPKPR